MNKSLITLIQESRSLIDKVIENEGEISTEIEESLISSNNLIADKVDRIVFFLEGIEAEKEYFSDKAKELHLMASRLKKSQEYFRSYLKGCIRVYSKDGEIIGINHKIQVVKSRSKLIIENEELIPDHYKRVVQTYEIDREKLREGLERGDVVEGAKLEDSYAIKVRLNSKVRS